MLFAVLCLFFLVIGGVSASDVMDVSNDPSNDESLGDSIYQVSDESIANNQLSNEAISSLDTIGTGDSGSLSVEDSNSNSKSSTANAASSSSAEVSGSSGSKSSAASTSDKATTSTANKTSSTSKTSSKTSTTIDVSGKTAYSGSPITVTLKDKNGKVLSGKKIKFNVTSLKKVYYKTTDSKGQASVTFTPVKNYKMIISYDGDGSYDGSKYSGTFKVKKAYTQMTTSSTTVPRSTYYVVTLKNKANGKPVVGKKIDFIVPTWKKKVYTKTTDKNGQARISLFTSKSFKVTVKFNGDSCLYGTSHKASIRTVKCGVNLSSSKATMYGGKFIVTLRNNVTGALIKNEKISINITNKNQVINKKTNSNGHAIIPFYHYGPVDVSIKFAGDKVYKGASAKVSLTSGKGNVTIHSANSVGLKNTYFVTLKNGAGVGLSSKQVTFTINGKTYKKTTNSKGQVSFVFNSYKLGKYPISYHFDGTKYYNTKNVRKNLTITEHTISMSSIISNARKLKTKIDAKSELDRSYTVTIDGKKYTLDEFSYLMAGTLTHIKAGSTADILPKDLSHKYVSTGNVINGKLNKNGYLKLASQVTSYAKANKNIPNYRSTSLGKMEADLYTYTFVSALDSYGKNKKLPSSVTVKTSYINGGYSISTSQFAKILNCKEAFNSKEFAQYLKTGGKSALNDAIKKKAKSLTSGLSSPMAKANAIFRFVRDDITYSFYSNSRKGASGTLSSKSGNCCDKANLIVAMCRSVGVYARYSHAQGCKFQSGLNAGHVWAQVYDTSTQTWYTADATSYRNEVGNIKNWNTKSYYRDTNYVLIPF